MIGRRPGEKVGEILVAEEEAPLTEETDTMYVIRSQVDVLHLGEPPDRGRARPYAAVDSVPLDRAEIRHLLGSNGLLNVGVEGLRAGNVSDRG